MDPVPDETLKELLASDPNAGWRLFVESYTPTLLGILERLGFYDHDEAMEIYLSVCERLVQDDCARLRSHDASEGSLSSWLARVARNAAVDWVRTRAGRRRLFKNVAEMPAFDRACFELFFWEGLRPSEIAETLRARDGRPVSLLEVLDGLDRLHEALNERQRGELVALSARNQRPASLDDAAEERPAGRPPEPRDERPGPESAVLGREQADAFDRALASLAPSEAAILRLKYVQGLSLSQIARSLHLTRLTSRRVKEIESRLRAQIVRAIGAPSLDALPDAGFLER